MEDEMDITQDHIDLVEDFDPRVEGPMFLNAENITLGALTIAHGSIANFTSDKMEIRLGLFQIHSIDGNKDIDDLLIPLTMERVRQLDETSLDLVEVSVTPVQCDCPGRDGFNDSKETEIYSASSIYCMNVVGNLNLIMED